MKASTSIALVLVCGLALLLQGCPPPGVTQFINHSGQPVTVHFAGKTALIPAGGKAAIKTLFWPERFEIETPKHTWHYDTVFVDREFMYPHFDIGLRITSTGRIYAVQAANAAHKVTGQPQGYPLQPKT